MPLERPTRRTVVKAGAWTAPVIVAATAAPTMAMSGTPTPVLSVNRGQTRYGNAGGNAFDSVIFQNFIITPTVTSDSQLTLRVTCSSAFYDFDNPPTGWTSSGGGGDLPGTPGLLFTYGGALVADTGIIFGRGVGTSYFDDNGEGGTFALTISAAGFPDVVQTYGPGGTTRPAHRDGSAAVPRRR